MSVASRLAFLGACATALAWFHASDVWHIHFASTGPYLLYNLARLGYAVFLAVALLGAGRAALIIATSGWRKNLDAPAERLLLCFYVSAGAMIPLLFATDAAGL